LGAQHVVVPALRPNAVGDNSRRLEMLQA